MNASTSHVEDRLLDFAYGELAENDARAVKSHLEACPQCQAQLDDIQGVRRVMSALPGESAPSAGLDSLLAYAEQAARRVQAGPAPKPAWWRRWVLPLAGVTAAVALGIVVHQASKGQPTLSEAAKDAAVIKAEGEAPKTALPLPVAAPVEDKDVQPFAQPAVTEEKAVAAKEPAPPPRAQKRASRDRTEALADDVATKGGELIAQGQVQAGPAAPQLAGVGSAQLDQVRASGGGAQGFGVLGDLGGKKVAEDRAAASAPPAASKPNTAPQAADALEYRGRQDAERVMGVSHDEREEAPEPARSRAPQRAATAAAPAPAAAPSAAWANAPTAETESVPVRVASEKKKAEAAPQFQDARVRELLDSARQSQSAGRYPEAASLLQSALALKVSDNRLRMEALSLSCDVQYALGHPAAAEAFCQTLVTEFPGSGAAQVATRRMAKEHEAAAQKSAAPAETDAP